MNEEKIIKASSMLSNVFSPFLLPLVGMLALFSFSYLSMLYWSEKLFIIIIVILFTILLPTTLVRIYNKYQGKEAKEGESNDNKMISSIISILCYISCYYTLATNHVPYSIGCVVLASLMIQVVCTLISVKWNISAHTAAAGGVTGAIAAFAEIFSFNPVWWLCVALLVSGVVGSNRIITKQHTLAQVVVGFLVGLICAIIAILFI